MNQAICVTRGRVAPCIEDLSERDGRLKPILEWRLVT